MKFALRHFVLLTIFVNAFFGCSTPTVSSSDDDEDYSSSRAFSSSSEDVSSSAEAASSSSLTQSSSSQFSSGNSEKKLTIYEAVRSPAFTPAGIPWGPTSASSTSCLKIMWARTRGKNFTKVPQETLSANGISTPGKPWAS